MAYNSLGGKMKKIFSAIGLATLATISFIITEQTTTVAKDIDEIMTTIKENYKQFEQEPINATIKENTIIPGQNGKKININVSYNEMKKIGTYNSDYYIYEEQTPEITIKKKYDKYIISGNKEKQMISLIFLVRDNDNIEDILKVLDQNQVKATFFIDSNWLEKNNELALALIKKEHTIGNLSLNLDYEQPEYIWINNIIKRIGKQKTNYCYAEEENEKNLKACMSTKNYTIMPNIIIKKSPLQEVKQQITNGSLIALDINQKTKEEIELIIKYIKSKGFSLVNLQTNLSEKNTN